MPGIGFLGGGVILRDGFHVRGLNTAATLWCSAAVGVLPGLLINGDAATRLEQLVARLSLEPGIRAVHWHAADDPATLAEAGLSCGVPSDRGGRQGAAAG